MEESTELTRPQLKFLVTLWSVATMLMLYIGFEMVTLSFPTTPFYGKIISCIVLCTCISFAFGKLIRYINKLK